MNTAIFTNTGERECLWQARKLPSAPAPPHLQRRHLPTQLHLPARPTHCSSTPFPCPPRRHQRRHRLCHPRQHRAPRGAAADCAGRGGAGLPGLPARSRPHRPQLQDLRGRADPDGGRRQRGGGRGAAAHAARPRRHRAGCGGASGSARLALGALLPPPLLPALAMAGPVAVATECLPSSVLNTPFLPAVPGDVIVAIDGKPVRNLFDLTSLLDERSVGDVVEVSRCALRCARRGQWPLLGCGAEGRVRHSLNLCAAASRLWAAGAGAAGRGPGGARDGHREGDTAGGAAMTPLIP